MEVDNLEIVISAEAQSAIAGLNRIKEALGGLKTQMKGIDTKKLKEALAPMEDFERKLKDIGKNIGASDNFKELQKQIQAAEQRLDSLLAKEHKMQTVGGVDKNSKSWRSLQYDIAKTCNELDVFYDKEKALDALRPKNFWEMPGYDPNGKTTVNTGEEKQIDSFSESVQRMNEAISNIPQEALPASEAISNIVRSSSGAERLKSIMSGLSDMFMRIHDGLHGGTGIEDFNESMQETIDRAQELQRTIKGMENGSIPFNAEVYENAVRTLAECNQRVQDFKNGIFDTSSSADRLRESMAGVGSAMKSAGAAAVRAFGSVVQKSFKAFLTGIKKLKSLLPDMGSLFDKVGSKMRMAFRVGALMLLRRAIGALFKDIKEGFDILARFSDSMGTAFNKNVSGFVSGIKNLGNQIVAAFEPILNVVLPIINALLAKLQQAMGVVAQFFAALTGAASWTRAKSNVTNYAKSLDSTGSSAKKARKEVEKLTVAGFDELNVLGENKEDEDNGGGAAGGINPADYFETAPISDKVKDWLEKLKKAWADADFTQIGKELGEKLAKMLANIPWDIIKENARKLGKSLATLINGFLLAEYDGKSLAYWLGHTIAESINTAFEFLNQFVSNLDWPLLGKRFCDFLTGALGDIDWPLIKDTMSKLGKGIADMLNEIFGNKETWELIGTTISNAINSLITLALDFVNTFDFMQFGSAIGMALYNAVVGIDWPGMGEALGKGVSGLFKALKGFFDSIDWAEAAKKIVTGICNFFKNITWSDISGALSSAVKALLAALRGAIEGVDWAQVPQYIVDSIADFFAGFDWPGLCNELGKLLGASLRGTIDALGSIWSMLQDAWGNIGEYFQKYIEDAGGDIIEGLWEGIKNALIGVATWIKQNIVDPFISGFKESFEIHSPSGIMKPLGEDIIKGAFEGIKNIIKDVYNWIKTNIFEPFYDSFKRAFGLDGGTNPFSELGGDILKGFWEGITDKVDWLKGKMGGFKDQVMQGMRDAFDVHSPSKEFEKLGQYLLPGLYEGMKDTMPRIQRDMQEMAKGLISSISSVTSSNISIGVDDSALREYTLNTGEDFALAGSFKHQMQRSLNANINAEINGDSTSVLKSAFGEVMNYTNQILAEGLLNQDKKFIVTEINLDGQRIARTVSKAQKKTEARYSPVTT